MCTYTIEIDLMFNRIGHDLATSFALTDHMREHRNGAGIAEMVQKG